MIPFLTALPFATKLAVTTIAFTAVFLFGMYLGNKIGVSSCQEAVIEAQRHSIETGVKQADVTDKIVTKYVDRIKIVKKNVVKEVKVYVKDNITLSGGFRLLHDSAVNNELPDPTRIVDEGTVKAQSVTATDALETVAANYGICHENSQTLQALQSWVREQSTIR